MARTDHGAELRELRKFYKRLKEYREDPSYYPYLADDPRELLVRQSGRVEQILGRVLGDTPKVVELLNGDKKIGLLLDTVNQAIGVLEGGATERESIKLSESKIQARPTVFIAHGGKSRALSRIGEFLLALGYSPIIAEDMPSEGRSVNEQVEWCLSQSDCAIVLYEAESPNEGKLYARPNVQIEAGRFQERFPKKVIYLREEQAKFPSNISEKVWERFTQDNMERAFLKIGKELVAFGFLKAVKGN